MIEMIMYFAIGFLVAALSVLVVVPLVHGRAVRLTRRRLEGAIPSSMAEIQADKDLLRAEFAMSKRRLEIKIEQLKAKSVSERAELGRKSDAINRLKIELGALRDQLHITEEEFAVRSNVFEAERPWPDNNSDSAKLSSPHDGRPVLAESQEDEVVALRMQVRALNEWLAQAGAEIRAVNAEHIDFESATEKLREERDKFGNFHRRVAELVQQLVVQATEDKIFSEHVQDLENRLAKQSQLLNEREFELGRLQGEVDIAHKAEAELRSDIIELDGRANAATAEKVKLQASLDRANGECTRLAYELANIKRRVEQTGRPYVGEAAAHRTTVAA
jgi:predicted  nucleic acid-binding Zn-ribbon protein